MRLFRSIALAATLSLVGGHLSTANAQNAEPSSTGKGIIGCALLGAEAVLVTEAAIDVSPNWLYYVGGGVGAVGGGIGGYFLEDSAGAKTNMMTLALGMLFAIPTTIAVLSATAYEEPRSYTQDVPPADEPRADPVTTIPESEAPTSPPPTPTEPSPQTAPPTTTPPAPAEPSFQTVPESMHRPKRPRIPQVLVAVDHRANLHLGLPAVEVRDTYSRGEMVRFGVTQRQELRVPLLRVAF